MAGKACNKLQLLKVRCATLGYSRANRRISNKECRSSNGKPKRL